MGALYISPNNQQIPESVLEVFCRKGFGEPHLHEFDQLKILAYPKQGVRIPNYLELDGYRMLVSGSVFYQGGTYRENLRLILEDIIKGELDFSELSGTFLIILNHAGANFFITDRSGSQNIFFDTTNGIISTSFLAVLAAGRNRQLNLPAITELLLTGNLMGPDTVISEVHRYERALSQDLPGLRKLDQEECAEDNSCLSYTDELDRQISVLRDYFRRREDLFNELGVISGLTGGFDSRLLYFLLRERIDNYRIYTTYRGSQTAEQAIAKALTTQAGDELYSPLHRSPLEINSSELSELINENIYFNDGLIRAHQYWLEEIKSRKYLLNLYGSYHVGFSGVGGEQYRNGEFLSKQEYGILNWINYELVYRHSGVTLANNAGGREIQSYIRSKIEALLGLDGNKISYLNIKRYYNEVWNPSTRTLRNNIENQAMLFCSPFTDGKISSMAYSAVNHVKKGFRFERDMINAICPELAFVRTDYDFAPKGRVPLKYKIQPAAKTILGLRHYHRLNFRRKSQPESGYAKLVRHHPFLGQYARKVKRLNILIDLDKVLSSNALYPLVIELGLFIEEFNEYLQSG